MNTDAILRALAHWLRLLDFRDLPLRENARGDLVGSKHGLIAVHRTDRAVLQRLALVEVSHPRWQRHPGVPVWWPTSRGYALLREHGTRRRSGHATRRVDAESLGQYHRSDCRRRRTFFFHPWSA